MYYFLLSYSMIMLTLFAYILQGLRLFMGVQIMHTPLATLKSTQDYQIMMGVVMVVVVVVERL